MLYKPRDFARHQFYKADAGSRPALLLYSSLLPSGYTGRGTPATISFSTRKSSNSFHPPARRLEASMQAASAITAALANHFFAVVVVRDALARSSLGGS